jgi:hypothetical protein
LLAGCLQFFAHFENTGRDPGTEWGARCNLLNRKGKQVVEARHPEVCQLPISKNKPGDNSSDLLLRAFFQLGRCRLGLLFRTLVGCRTETVDYNDQGTTPSQESVTVAGPLAGENDVIEG